MLPHRLGRLHFSIEKNGKICYIEGNKQPFTVCATKRKVPYGLPRTIHLCHKDYTTYRHFVPAPYFRKVFTATTDCPHREKVGWTGDTALSSEHMLMAMDVGVSFREWLRSIRAAQKETGELPGMVPACDWPYQWGDGPVWDAALICIPYYICQYTGDREILSENAAAILKYLRFAADRRNRNGCGAPAGADSRKRQLP